MESFTDINAINRYKSVLNDFIPSININKYKNCSYFEDILRDVIKDTKNIHGLSLLTIYDISIAIADKYNINTHQIYIIRNETKYAIELLNLTSQLHTRNLSGYIFHYLTIPEIRNSFKKSKYSYDTTFIENNYNGDAIETYLYNWQKIIPK